MKVPFSFQLRKGSTQFGNRHTSLKIHVIWVLHKTFYTQLTMHEKRRESKDSDEI